MYQSASHIFESVVNSVKKVWKIDQNSELPETLTSPFSIIILLQLENSSPKFAGPLLGVKGELPSSIFA